MKKNLLNNKYVKILIIIVVLFLAYSIYKAIQIKKDIENWSNSLSDNLLYILKETGSNLTLDSTVLEFQEIINKQAKSKLDTLETDKNRKFLIDKLMTYENGSDVLTKSLKTWINGEKNWLLKNGSQSNWVNKLTA